MTRDPRDTSTEEPDGGNLQVRFRRGPGLGNRPGLLNKGERPQAQHGGSARQRLTDRLVQLRLMAAGQNKSPAPSVLVDHSLDV